MSVEMNVNTIHATHLFNVIHNAAHKISKDGKRSLSTLLTVCFCVCDREKCWIACKFQINIIYCRQKCVFRRWHGTAVDWIFREDWVAGRILPAFSIQILLARTNEKSMEIIKWMTKHTSKIHIFNDDNQLLYEFISPQEYASRLIEHYLLVFLAGFIVRLA